MLVLVGIAMASTVHVPIDPIKPEAIHLEPNPIMCVGGMGALPRGFKDLRPGFLELPSVEIEGEQKMFQTTFPHPLEKERPDDTSISGD